MSLPVGCHVFKSSTAFVICEEEFLSSIPLPGVPPPPPADVRPPAPSEERGTLVVRPYSPCSPTADLTPPRPLQSDDTSPPGVDSPGEIANKTGWIPVVRVPPACAPAKSWTVPDNIFPPGTARGSWMPVDGLPSLATAKSSWSPIAIGSIPTGISKPAWLFGEEPAAVIATTLQPLLGAPPSSPAATDSTPPLATSSPAVPLSAKRSSRWDNSSPVQRKVSPGSNGITSSVDRSLTKSSSSPIVVIAKGVRKVGGGVNNMGFRVAYGGAGRLPVLSCPLTDFPVAFNSVGSVNNFPITAAKLARPISDDVLARSAGDVVRSPTSAVSANLERHSDVSLNGVPEPKVSAEGALPPLVNGRCSTPSPDRTVSTGAFEFPTSGEGGASAVAVLAPSENSSCDVPAEGAVDSTFDSACPLPNNDDSSCSKDSTVSRTMESDVHPPPPPPPPAVKSGRRRRAGQATHDDTASPSESDDGGRRRSSRIRSMEARREKEKVGKPGAAKPRRGGKGKASGKEETDAGATSDGAVTTAATETRRLSSDEQPPDDAKSDPVSSSATFASSNASSAAGEQEQFAIPLAPPTTSPFAGAFSSLGEDAANHRPEKVKSRWRRSSEMEVMSVVSGGGFVPAPCTNSNESTGTPPRGRSPAPRSSSSSPLQPPQQQMVLPWSLGPPPPPPPAVSSGPPSVASSPSRSVSDVSSVNSLRLEAPAPVPQLPAALANLSIAPSGFFSPGEITEDWSEQDEVVQSLAQYPLPLRLRVVQQHHHHHSSGSDSERGVDSPGSRSQHRRSRAPLVPAKERPPYLNYEEISENIYLCDCKREVGRLPCYCNIPDEDEVEMGEAACGSSCINRQLMMECDSRCPTGELCTNKRFQKKQWSKVEPFKTEKKGWGLRALEDMCSNTFVLEYVGEVLNNEGFNRRVERYSDENQSHYYFMALKSRQIIDATQKGNMSRFINHSCDPSCITQKWTVNDELRVGFFTSRDVKAGEELTFDYQFQRYGEEAQKCYCEAPNCRGFIGGDKQTPLRKDKRDTIKKKRRRETLADVDLEEEIEKFSQLGGLKNRHQTLNLCRLMVRVEDSESRLVLLQSLCKTDEPSCLRLFLDYHGLSLMWSWMADVGVGDENIPLKREILKTLQRLPITNRTVLTDSKVMPLVQKWADQLASRAAKRPRLESPDSAPPVLPPPPSPVNLGIVKLEPSSEVSPPTAQGTEVLSVEPTVEDDSSIKVEPISDPVLKEKTKDGEEEKKIDAEQKEDMVDAEKEEDMVDAEKEEDMVDAEKEEDKVDGEQKENKVDGEQEKNEARQEEEIVATTEPPSPNQTDKMESEPTPDEIVGEDCDEKMDTESCTAEATSIKTETHLEGERLFEETSATINRETDSAREDDTQSSAAKVDVSFDEPGSESWIVVDACSDSDAKDGEPATPDEDVAAKPDSPGQTVNGDAAPPAAGTESVSLEAAPASGVDGVVPGDNQPPPPPPPVLAPVVDTADVMEVASVANSLLESWSVLKDVYRIPRREQILDKMPNDSETTAQTKDSHGRNDSTTSAGDGADRRDRDSRSEERDVRDRRRDRDRRDDRRDRSTRDRDSERGNSSRDDRSHRERSGRESRSERDRGGGRDRDRDRDRRSDHSSSRDGHRGDRSHSRHSRDRSPARREHRNRDPRTSAPRDGRMTPTEDEILTGSNRVALLPTPALSKHERRHLFEMQVHEEDAMRRQQDDYYRAQEQHMQQSAAMAQTMDPATAAYYDPVAYAAMMGATQFFDPTTGYPLPPLGAIALPGELQDGLMASPMLTSAPLPTHTMLTGTSLPPHPMLSGAVDLGTASQEPASDMRGLLPGASMGPPVMTHSMAVLNHPDESPTAIIASTQQASSVSQQSSGESPVPTVFHSAMMAMPPTSHLTPFDPATTVAALGASSASVYPVYSPSTASQVGQQATQPTAYADTPPSTALHYIQPPAQTVFYTTTPQGVVVQLPAPDQAWPQVVTAAGLVGETPPPPEPPRQPRPTKLPPNWKTAKDSEGNVYFYHTVTRQTQWEPPVPVPDADTDLGTPTFDELKPSKKKIIPGSLDDNSSELVRRTKELFRTKMSQFIVHCLNPYRKPDCKLGRISSTDEFKHLARKLTHFVMAKELKHCRNVEDLECNENVKHKSKDFVRKYMSKFGPIYKKTASPKDDEDE